MRMILSQIILLSKFVFRMNLELMLKNLFEAFEEKTDLSDE
ncbi:hypothetical protein [Eubacterium sp. MSJ-13]|nr:hypothetical protein [Eubacterium sp. MSJ-13]